MAHTCSTCGLMADDASSLCNPTETIISCSFCNMPDVGVNHICKEKFAAMRYSCETCGKVAVDTTGICKPVEIV